MIEGYGVTQIADILTKDKVLIPSAYVEIHYPENNHSSKKRGIEDPKERKRQSVCSNHRYTKRS